MCEGLLLLNLGSPDMPSRPAVRRYLREFLMDRYVIDLPWALRAALVHGLIAPLRSGRTARAYAEVWASDGSPLVAISRRFHAKIKEQLPNTAVEMGMRYGRPGVVAALSRLRTAGVEKLRVVPLYPQFAKSSTFTGMQAVARGCRKLGWQVPTVYLRDFFGEPEWIESLAANVAAANRDFRAEMLLLSYHGLPEHHIRELDRKSHCLTKACCERIEQAPPLCYRAQCFATSRALVTAAKWQGKYTVSFQSRLGRRPWIRPFSDEVILQAAHAGVRRVLVACPSFVADCLETLEEVAIRMKRDFIGAGGEDLRLVPAVNDSASWVDGFVKMAGREDLRWVSGAEALGLVP